MRLQEQVKDLTQRYGCSSSLLHSPHFLSSPLLSPHLPSSPPLLTSPFLSSPLPSPPLFYFPTLSHTFSTALSQEQLMKLKETSSKDSMEM
eukprot:746191-Hanusia_phi.AAC.1